MCGICGILSISPGFDASEPTVVAMRDTMVHRGPDDAGADSWGDGRVAFGHRRLSIVDLSPAGHNPMPNEDQTVWITFNGEIYNHRALRSELEAKGHRYRSNTDTETIIHLYEEEGPRCVERLHGMFAIAIWDERRQELFLARDRLGIKPLYYTQPPGGFAFASEIKALLAHPARFAGSRRRSVLSLPDVRLHAGAADHVQGHQQARAGRAHDRPDRRIDDAATSSGRRCPTRRCARSPR